MKNIYFVAMDIKEGGEITMVHRKRLKGTPVPEPKDFIYILTSALNGEELTAYHLYRKQIPKPLLAAVVELTE